MNLTNGIGRNLKIRDFNRIYTNLQPDKRLQDVEDSVSRRMQGNTYDRSQTHIVTASKPAQDDYYEPVNAQPKSKVEANAAVGDDDSEGFLSRIGNAVADGFKYLKDKLGMVDPETSGYGIHTAKKERDDFEKLMKESLENQKRILEHRQNMLDPQKKQEFLQRQNNFMRGLVTNDAPVSTNSDFDFHNGIPTSMIAKLTAYQQLNEQYKGRSISNEELDKLADEKVKKDLQAVEDDIKNGTIKRNVSTNVIDRASKKLEYDRLTNSDYVRTLMKREEDAENFNRSMLEARAADENEPVGYWRPGTYIHTISGVEYTPMLQQSESTNKSDNIATAPTFLNDVVQSFRKGQTLTRLANEGGKISQIGEFQDMSSKVRELLDLYSSYDNISKQISRYSSRQNDLSVDELRAEGELLDTRKDLVARIRELLESNVVQNLASWESAEKDIDVSVGGIKSPNGTTRRTTLFKSTWRPRNILENANEFLQKYNIEFGLGISQYLNGFNKLNNELDSIRRSKYFDKSPVLQQRASDIQNQIRNILTNFDNVLSERRKQYTENAKEEAKDLEKLDAQYKVSDVYQARQQLAEDMDMSSINTIMYALPQQLGTSNPYPWKMITTLGLAAANGKATLARNLLGQMLTGISFGAVSASQGKDEANAEVYDSTKNIFVSNLAENGRYEDFIRIGKKVLNNPDASQDDIVTAYILGKMDGKLGSIETAVAKDLADSFIGSSRQYDLNVAAVSSDAITDAILMTTRVGWFEDAYRVMKGLSLGKASYLVSPKEYAKVLTPKSWQKAWGKLRSGASAFGAKLPMFGVRHETAKAAKSMIARNMVSNIFEAGQEGVQRDIALERESGEYNSFRHDNMVADVIKDLQVGVPLTLEWITGGALNFGAIKDEQYIPNMNGGFLGSLFQSGATQMMTQAPSVIRNSIDAQEIINSISGEKASHRDNIERTAAYLKNLDFEKRQRINNLLDSYKRANENLQASDPNEGIPIEAIEDTRKMYSDIFKLSFNRRAVKAASSVAPIGTKRWRYAMGLIQDAYMSLEKSNNTVESEESAINQALQKARAELGTQSFNKDKVGENVGNIVNEVNEDEELARLSAAIRIRDEYKELSGLSRKQSKIAKLAQDYIDRVNENRSEKITTREQLNDKISDINLNKQLEESYRNIILAEIQRDQDRFHLNKLLSANQVDNSYLSKLLNEYFDSKSSDEKFYAKIQDAYNKRLAYLQKVEDFEIADWNRVYHVGGKTYIAEEVQREDGSIGYVKRLYNEETGEVYGPAYTFDKEEFVWSKEVENYTDDEAKAKWEAEQEQKELDRVSNPLQKELNDLNNTYNRLKNLPKSKSKKQERSLKNQLANKLKRYSKLVPEGFKIDKNDDGYFIARDIPEETTIPTGSTEPEPQSVKPTEAQAKTIAAIDEYRTNTENSSQRTRTTAQDYFFKVAGKLVRRSRVHSAFEQQKPESAQAEIIERELKEAKDRSIDEYKQLVIKKQKEYNDELYDFYSTNREEAEARVIDLSVYLEDDLISDPISIRSVARILAQGHGNAALHAGSIVDDILRRLFEDEDLTINSEIHLPKRRPHTISDYLTAEQLNGLKQSVNKFKEDHPGYIFYSKPVTWTGKLADGTEIAGETDLLAIDREGNVAIIDFKTSKNDFTDAYIDVVYPGDNWSTKTQYSRQQTAYMHMVEQSLPDDFGIVKSLHILPFVVNRVVGSDTSIFERFDSIEMGDIVDLAINDDITGLFNGNTKSQEIKRLKDASNVISDAIQDLHQRIAALKNNVSKKTSDLYNKISNDYSELQKVLDKEDSLSIQDADDRIKDIMSDIDVLREAIKDDVQRSASPGSSNEGAPTRRTQGPPSQPAGPTTGSSMPGFTFVPVEEGSPNVSIPGAPAYAQQPGPDTNNRPTQPGPMPGPMQEPMPGPPPAEEGPAITWGPPTQPGPEEGAPTEGAPSQPGRPVQSNPKYKPLDRRRPAKHIDAPMPEYLETMMSYKDYDGPISFVEDQPAPPPEDFEGRSGNVMEDDDYLRDALDDVERGWNPVDALLNRHGNGGPRSAANTPLPKEVPLGRVIEKQNERIFSFSAVKDRPWTGQLTWYNFIQYMFGTKANAQLKRDLQKLKQWSTDKEFLKEATIIVDVDFYRKHHKGFGWDKAGKKPTDRFPSGIAKGYELRVSIIYKGETINNIPISYATEMSEQSGRWEGEYLYNKLAALVDKMDNDPNIKGKNARIIVSQARRTNGILEFPGENETPVYRTLLDAGLISNEDDLLTILDDHKIGLSDTNEINDVVRDKNNATIAGGVMRAFPYGREVVGGFVVYNWDLGYMEDDTHTNVVPIFLTPKELTHGEHAKSDVNTIVNILKAIAENPRNMDKKFTIEHNGKTIETPLTYIGVLKMLIRFSPTSREQLNSSFVFDWLRDQNNKVAKTADDKNYGYKYVQITDNEGELVTVDLNNPEQVEQLIKTLSSSRFFYANNRAALTYNLGEDNTKESKNKNPFKGVKQFFKDNPDVDKIEISDSFVIDRKDVDFHEDGTWQSLSGAAWQIRHGLINTSLKGIHSALISINDLELQVFESKQEETASNNQNEPTTKPEESNQETPIAVQQTSIDAAVENEILLNQLGLEEVNNEYEGESSSQSFSLDQLDDFEDESDPNDMFQKQKHLSKKPLNEKLAKKRIRRLLGRRFPVEIIDEVYAIFKDGYAVGVCRENMIGLSTYAEQGTEWHESFHKIFEFLVDPLKRERIYARYAERLGTEDRRTIAEAIADDFKFFMMDLPSVTFARLNVIKTFKEIKAWFNAFNKISDKELAKIYLMANFGVYRYINPRKGVLERFRSVFDGVLYSFVKDNNGNDIKLKYFVNDKQLRDALKLLSVQIITGNNIDDLGYRAGNISLELSAIRKLNKNRKLETDEDADSRWFTLLTGWDKDEKDRTIQQNMFHEIFDNWDNAIKQRMVNVLAQYGLIFRKNKTLEEAAEEKEKDPDKIAEMLSGHMDEFYLTDRRNDIDSAIIFFLSTIPNRRFATREDLIFETDEYGNILKDDNGKEILKYKKDAEGNYITDARGNKIIDGSVKSLTYVRGNEERRTTVNVKSNAFGMAEFIPFDKAYAEVFREIHNAKSFADMLQRIKNRGKTDPMFYYIEQHINRWEFQSLIRHEKTNKPVAMLSEDGVSKPMNESDYMYVKDISGHYHIVWAKDNPEKGMVKYQVVPNAYILTNPDRQALATRFYLAFKAQRLEFNFVYASERKSSANNGDIEIGRYDYKSRESGTHASTAIYPPMWFENLRLGITGMFEVGENSKIVRKENGKKLSDEAKFFVDFKSTFVNAFNKNMAIVTIDGKKWNIHSEADMDSVRAIFVQHLNNIGIDIDRSVFDYFLEHKFGSKDIDTKLKQLMTMLTVEPTEGNGSFSYNTFSNMLVNVSKAVENNNDMSLIEVDYDRSGFKKNKKKYTKKDDNKPNSGMYLYANNSFVKELAVFYGEYRLDTDEFMQVGPENTQMFTQADDHTASYITNDINNGTINEHGVVVGSTILKDMMGWIYNYMDGKGSRIIKHLISENRSNLKLGTFLGINNLDRHDGGTKYSKISTREDFLSKLTLLSEGHILFPTLSDKSTWFFLHTDTPGEQLLPGFDYLRGINTNELMVVDKTGKLIAYNDSVVDQLIEYALCEDASIQMEIKKAQNQNNRKVKNFHTDEQGQRYQFMLGVYDEKGNFIPFNRKKDDNGKEMTPEDCLKLAHEKFFDKDDETKRQLIRDILQKRLGNVINDAVKNDIIYKDSKGFLHNRYLDYSKIEALKDAYKKHDAYNNSSDKLIEHMAIGAYLTDANARMIMSIEETERMYTGHPGFFEHVYDNNGVLIDRHGDEVKRYGGLGSTGPNNREDVPNISENYRCAEITDWKIGSAISDTLSEAFRDNEYRETALRIKLDEIGGGLVNKLKRRKAVAEIYGKDKDGKYVTSLDDIIKIVKDAGLEEIVENKITAEASSFEGDINVADGTAYISDKMAENLLIQRGAYTKRVRAAFQYLRGRKDKEGKDVLDSYKAYRIVVGALLSTEKYSAFGYRMEDGVTIHYYNKFALFPIFDQIAYGFTADLYQKMKEANVDMVLFDSAVKAGSENAQKFNPDMTDEEVKNFSFKGKTYEQRYAFIRRQLNTEPHESETMHVGTQALKVALSNIIPDGTYDTEDGVVYGEDVRDAIMESLNELSKAGKESLMSEISNDGENVDIDKFSTYIKKQLRSRNADENTISAFDVITEGRRKRFKIPMAAMSSISWVESIISSEINRKVIDVNLPGNAYYQRSVFGMDSPSRTLIGAELYNGKELQMINEEGSMDAVISIDYFYHIIPKDIRYNFNEARKWLIDNGIIGENAKANTMAYRIPTQAQSSIHALRFVDVIPVMRDTIILPKEFTKITGSDFDIDKLFLSTLNYEVGKDGKITSKFDKEKNRNKYYQNRLLSNYLLLLKDGGKLDPETGKVIPGRTIQYLHRSIDNDTSLVRNTHDKLVKRQESVEETFGFGSINTQVNIKKQFINGKFGIGPYALNNNAQILTMLYKVKFADNPILRELGMLSLSESVDKDGNSIMSWMSAMINAHVDVAKDPFIADMNVNKYTYNLSNLLLRTGMGDQTFAFLMQDVLMESARVFDNAGDSLIEDSGLSTSEIQRNAVHEYLHKRFDGKSGIKDEMDLIFGDVYMDKAKREKMALLQGKILNIGRQMFTLSADGKRFERKFYVQKLVNGKSELEPVEGSTIFEDMITNPSRNQKYAIKSGDKYVFYSREELQLYTALLKELIDPYAQAMSNIVNYTKIDTKKQGATYFEQLDYLDKFEDLHEDYTDEDNKHMFTSELNDMLDKSFIATKTRLSIDLFRTILGSDVINSVNYQRGFGKLLDQGMSALGLFSDSHRKTLSNYIIGAIKGGFFDKYSAERNIDIKNLFYGPNSIANRLQVIKSELRKDTGKYYEYAQSGTITNTLLDVLTSVPYERTQDDPMFVTIPNNALKNKDELDDIAESWSELLKDDNPEHANLRKFAEDLILYAFYTSADTAGFTKIFKYVPNEWRLSSGYADYMNMVALAFRDEAPAGSQQLLIDAVLNAWQNPELVKLTKDRDKLGNRFRGIMYHYGEDENKNITRTYFKLLAPVRGKYKMISRNREGEFPMFYKIQNRYDKSNPLLYIKIGEGSNENLTSSDKQYPIYYMVRPKGRRYKALGQTFQVYEYGRNTGVTQHLDGYKFGAYMTREKVESLRNDVDKLANYISENPESELIDAETEVWGMNHITDESNIAEIKRSLYEGSGMLTDEELGIQDENLWDETIDRVKKQCGK